MRWAENVGGNVRKWRLVRDITQEHLAAEASISMRHLGRIERGEGNPTVDVLERLASVLQLSARDLFEEHAAGGSR